MRYQADFVYNAICKFLSVVVTISLAVYFASYWALVFGKLASAIIVVIISFIAPRRLPRFTLSQWRKIWHFAKWTLTRGLAVYVLRQGDKLILGRYGDAGMVGAYSVAREIAEMPITEISMPTNRALSPGFSALQDQTERLVLAVTKSLGAIATITFPIGLGFAAIAPQAIPVMLGPGWDEAIPILQILSLSAVMSTLAGVCNNTLAILGYIRDSAITLWLRAIVMLATAIPGAILYGAEGVAAAFLFSGLFSICNTFYRLSYRIPEVKIKALVSTLARPALGGLVMLAAVLWLNTLPLESDIQMLLAKVALGGLVYTALMYGMWHVRGRPDGLESYLTEKIEAFRLARR